MPALSPLLNFSHRGNKYNFFGFFFRYISSFFFAYMRDPNIYAYDKRSSHNVNHCVTTKSLIFPVLSWLLYNSWNSRTVATLTLSAKGRTWISSFIRSMGFYIRVYIPKWKKWKKPRSLAVTTDLLSQTLTWAGF